MKNVLTRGTVYDLMITFKENAFSASTVDLFANWFIHMRKEMVVWFYS